MSTRRLLPIATLVLTLASALSASATAEEPPRPADDEPADAAPEPEAEKDATPWADRVLPFEPSDDDRAALGTGFTGYFAVPEETGFTQGVRIAGVQEGQALDLAGLQDGDVIVSFAGTKLDGPTDELIAQLRAILKPLKPDTRTTLEYYRADEGVQSVEFWLGRSPPSFAQLETPAAWFDVSAYGAALRDPEIDAWIAAATALDDGGERLADTVARHRKRFAKQDVFRLRETVVAQIHTSAQERLADLLLARLGRHPLETVAVAAGLRWLPARPEVAPLTNPDWEAELDAIETFLVRRMSARGSPRTSTHSPSARWWKASTSTATTTSSASARTAGSSSC